MDAFQEQAEGLLPIHCLEQPLARCFTLLRGKLQNEQAGGGAGPLPTMSRRCARRAFLRTLQTVLLPILPGMNERDPSAHRGLLGSLLMRIGSTQTVVVVSGLAVLASVAITAAIMMGPFRHFEPSVVIAGITIGAIAPALVAPPILMAFVRLYAQLDQAQEALAALAFSDALTGVPNRRRVMNLADAEWQRARRYERQFAVLMLDIDFFKRINDGFGHAVGDEVLKGVAQRCASTLRTQDMMGRTGGEEFLVLLPETTLAEAAVLAERLRLSVAGKPFGTGEGELEVTISIGAAAVTSSITGGLDALLRAADAALYAAKKGGRNRVACAADAVVAEHPSRLALTGGMPMPAEPASLAGQTRQG